MQANKGFKEMYVPSASYYFLWPPEIIGPLYLIHRTCPTQSVYFHLRIVYPRQKRPKSRSLLHPLTINSHLNKSIPIPRSSNWIYFVTKK